MLFYWIPVLISRKQRISWNPHNSWNDPKFLKYDFPGTFSTQIRVELLKSTQFLKWAQMLEIDPHRGDFKKPKPELVIPKTSLKLVDFVEINEKTRFWLFLEIKWYLENYWFLEKWRNLEIYWSKQHVKDDIWKIDDIWKNMDIWKSMDFKKLTWILSKSAISNDAANEQCGEFKKIQKKRIPRKREHHIRDSIFIRVRGKQNSNHPTINPQPQKQWRQAKQ